MAMETSGPSSFLDALTARLDATAANRQQLAGLAAGGVIPASAAPGPTMFQRMFGVGIDGTPYQPPSAPASAVPAMPSATASGAGTGAGGGPAAAGLMSYIAQAAAQRGIDPQVAQRVALSEGGRSGMGVGDGGSSFGPFQLHYGGVAGGPNAGAGLGDDFTAATGKDARDPANAQAAIDFALDHAAKKGWSAFHGAARAGIGQFDGIGRAAPSAMAYSGARQPAQTAMPIATADNAAGGPAQPSAPMAQPSAAPAGVSPTGAMPAAAPGGVAAAAGAPGLPSMSQIQALIANPATRQMGLATWQQLVSPKQVSFGKPGEVPFVNGRQSAPAIPLGPQKLEPGAVLVPGQGGAPIASAPPKLEPTDIGTGPYGDKIRGSFNPQTGQMAPFAGAPGVVPAVPAGAPAAGAPAGGAPAASPAGLNTDYLKSLDPAIASQVQAIAEGRMKLPAAGSRSPLAARLPSMVQQYDPSFDQSNAEARYGTREAFAHGDVAKTIVAGNTAIQHLGDLSDQAEALNNSGSPAWNKVGQFVGDHTGGNLAGKKFAATLGDFAGELTKFYRGTGGTEADLERLHHDLDPSQSPAQLRAGIEQQAKLISGKVSAVQSQWHQGMGPQASDYPIISTESQAALDRIGKRPSAPPAAASPPVAGARQAADGHFYVPDPARSGKYLRVGP